MKRMLPGLCVILFVGLSPALHAQSYIFQRSTGVRQFISEIRPNAQLVYPPPKENVLSSWQNIPFEWRFYGEPVRGFYISDNGYITFDSLASASIPDNTAIPSAAEPNNAIYGYWDDLHLSAGGSQWSNEVRTLLWGTAPNREFVIMWIGVVPKGVEYSSSNNVSFAIALHEQGGFDVVFVAGRHTVPMNGSVGVENREGTRATMIAGSPDFPYPSVTADPSDDITYSFSYSAFALDGAVISSSLPATVKINTSVPVTATIQNRGIDTITSLRLHYRVDDAVEQVRDIAGLRLSGGQNFEVAASVPWTPSVAGRMHHLAIWISALNGTAGDGNPSNDSLFQEVFTQLGISADRNVLVEEFTGAWCGWCPDGGLQMQAIENSEPRAVLVSIHAGGTDAMIVPEGAALAAAYNPAYPQAMIDRFLFSGEKTVPINRTSNAWQVRVAERLGATTPLSLRLGRRYDPVTRELIVDARVDFVDHAYPGELRLHLLIVEDRVTGKGAGYDQANYYSKNPSYPNHPYFSETNPITGFVHRHVLRAVLTGTWGEQIPYDILPGSSVARQYRFSIPPNYRESEIGILSFVTSHGADLRKREVLNAAEMPLLAPNGMPDPVASGFRLGRMAPNPSRGVSRMEMELPVEGLVSVELYTIAGVKLGTIRNEILPAGKHILDINLDGRRSGIYVLVINMAGRRWTRWLPVVR